MKTAIDREIASPFLVMLISLIGMNEITFQGFKKVATPCYSDKKNSTPSVL